MTSRFKVGDRVVADHFYNGISRGVVKSLYTNTDFPIDVIYDEGSSDSWKDCEQILPESIYDSPLYKALKEVEE